MLIFNLYGLKEKKHGLADKLIKAQISYMHFRILLNWQRLILKLCNFSCKQYFLEFFLCLKYDQKKDKYISKNLLTGEYEKMASIVFNWRHLAL